jgi:hypothetical protein
MQLFKKAKKDAKFTLKNTSKIGVQKGSKTAKNTVNQGGQRRCFLAKNKSEPTTTTDIFHVILAGLLPHDSPDLHLHFILAGLLPHDSPDLHLHFILAGLPTPLHSSSAFVETREILGIPENAQKHWVQRGSARNWRPARE